MRSTDLMHVQALRTWHTIPGKDAWGHGPWVAEPDKAQWTDRATGLPGLALRNAAKGVWCGYVGVHRTHPLHGHPCDDRRVARLIVHGDVNYSAACQDEPGVPTEHLICHIPEPGEPDDVWWFGFDCARGKDYRPGELARLRREGIPEDDIFDPADYCTLQYVQSNCAMLALQLSAITEDAATIRNNRREGKWLTGSW